MNTLSRGHDAGFLHQVFVDRRLGLDQQDGAGDHQVPEVREERVALDRILERAHRHVGEQVEVARRAAASSSSSRIVPSMGCSDSRWRGSARAFPRARGPASLREMVDGGRVDGQRAAIELVPVGMLEDLLADHGLRPRIGIQLRDDAGRIPFEQYAAGVEDHVP